MKKILYDKFDKNKIALLPKILFSGRIFVIDTIAQADRAVDFLLSKNILGIDTETRPSFKKGRSYKVSLLQVSTLEECFLFRLNKIDLPEALIKLLEDKKIPKIGISLHDDILYLKRRKIFIPGNFIDLQKLVGQLGIKDMSLQKIYANLFGQKISKTVQLSNWENEPLDERQKLYAATDAWACLMIYDELQRLKSTLDYELIQVEDVSKEQENNKNQES